MMKRVGAVTFAGLSCSALVVVGWMTPAVMALPTSGEPLVVAQATAQSPLRIAVLDFDYASTGSNWWYVWGDEGPAKGVSDLLTNKLVQNGTYTLIERSRVAAVLQEQNLAQAGRIDPATAAQVGRILGADAVVIGSITRFNISEGRSGTSILGIGGNHGRDKADVQITARLVSTTTAEILAAVEGQSQAEQGSGGFSIGGLVSFGSSHNNEDELLSQAAEDAVGQVVTKLAAEAPRLAALPPSLPAVEAIVADVTGNQVIINKGTQDGFRTGMTLSIERVTREVKDPTTGEVLRTVTAPIGRIELTEVDQRSGVGRIVNGTGFQVGDRAQAVQ